MTTAVILAAGMGTRLGALTEDRPKAMLEFEGRTLLDHQVAAYRRAGVDRIVVVGGYRDDVIQCEGVVRYRNADYDTTNMVESLMCARDELRGPVIVSYGDILFEDAVLRTVRETPAHIGVTVDVEWQPYWEARYGDITIDTEALEFGPDGRIVRLGQPDPRPDQIDARYVGLLRLDAQGVKTVIDVYDQARSRHAGGPWQTSALFEKGYLTDLLQEIIDQGFAVEPVVIRHGWLEFDTTEDYRLAIRWAREGRLGEFCALGGTPSV